MPKFADLEKKISEKKQKLDSLKGEASKDAEVKKKYDATVMALAKCITEAADGRRAEDIISKATKDFDVSYKAYKKAKDELRAALGKSKIKINFSLKDLEFPTDVVKLAEGIYNLFK